MGGPSIRPGSTSSPPDADKARARASDHNGRAGFGAAAGSRGSTTVNVLPRPGSLCTDTRPPWAVTSAWTMDRPSPAPPLARVREASAR